MARYMYQQVIKYRTSFLDFFHAIHVAASSPNSPISIFSRKPRTNRIVNALKVLLPRSPLSSVLRKFL